MSFFRLSFGIGIVALIPAFFVLYGFWIGEHEVYNFSAGPASLPMDVKKRAFEEFFNYKGSGASVFELSHRDVDGPVQALIAEAEQRVRRVLNVPRTHKIMYMHGGAHAFFSSVPLNLCKPEEEAAYVVTGYWSQRASDEGEKQLKNVTRIKGVDEKEKKLDLSWQKKLKILSKSCFVHICGR